MGFEYMQETAAAAAQTARSAQLCRLELGLSRTADEPLCTPGIDTS